MKKVGKSRKTQVEISPNLNQTRAFGEENLNELSKDKKTEYARKFDHAQKISDGGLDSCS